MSKGYVEREAVLSICNEMISEPWNSKTAPASWSDAYLEFMDAVEHLPAADSVEVVRCNDCTYWTKFEDSAQGLCALFRHYPTGSWYCANGKRKEGANNEATDNTKR